MKHQTRHDDISLRSRLINRPWPRNDSALSSTGRGASCHRPRLSDTAWLIPTQRTRDKTAHEPTGRALAASGVLHNSQVVLWSAELHCTVLLFQIFQYLSPRAEILLNFRFCFLLADEFSLRLVGVLHLVLLQARPQRNTRFRLGPCLTTSGAVRGRLSGAQHVHNGSRIPFSSAPPDCLRIC